MNLSEVNDRIIELQQLLADQELNEIEREDLANELGILVLHRARVLAAKPKHPIHHAKKK